MSTIDLSPTELMLHLRELELRADPTPELSEVAEALRARLRGAPSSEVLGLLSMAIDCPATPDNDQGYWACISELHGRSDASIFEACSAWTRAAAPRARQAGADVLSQLGYSVGYPFAGQSQPFLEELLDDAESAVVKAALIALGHLGRGNLSLISCRARDPDVCVRYAVVHALLPRDEPLARHTLAELSQDTQTKVRDWATFALGTSSYDDHIVRAALLARLSDEDDETRGEAFVGLAKRKDARVLPAIAKELTRSDVGNLAIEAAARYPNASMLPALETLLNACPEDQDILEAITACRGADATSPGPGRR
jgi:HEAT repeat protein